MAAPCRADVVINSKTESITDRVSEVTGDRHIRTWLPAVHMDSLCTSCSSTQIVQRVTQFSEPLRSTTEDRDLAMQAAFWQYMIASQ